MELRIFSIQPRKLFYIALSLQVLTLFLSILIMIPQIPWASQGSGSKYWKGDLTTVISGHKTGESYNDLEMYYDTDDDYATDYIKGQNSTFELLTWASVFYIIFETLGMALNILACLTMLCIKRFRYCILCIMIISFLQAFMHFLAFFQWVFLSEVTFSGQCSKSDLSYSNYKQAPICAQAGAVISMIILILYIVISVGWYLLGTVHIFKYRNTSRQNIQFIPL